MRRDSFWLRTKNKIENYLPMTLGSLLLLVFLCYLFYIVGRSVYTNYQSNKSIEVEQQKIVELKKSISQFENEIAYYKSNSYKERQARALLGYKAPGENVIALNYDQPEEKNADSGSSEPVIKTPNYILWWNYFTKD